LIASDVPEALDPVQVKNSNRVVNGPLGRYHHGSQTTSFFFNTDTELQHMVEDYYNLAFNESIANNRIELSQDERCFMASVEESSLLKDGLYEIPYYLKIDGIQFQTIVSSWKSDHPG